MRLTYLGLVVLTIAIGLWVHRGGLPLGTAAQDVAGDALWAVMMVWWVGAITPATAVLTRGAVALAVCMAVEVSQLVHAPWIDGVRASTLGSLVLGTGFDARDLLAYAGGVAVGVALECLARARRPRVVR